MVSLPLGSQVVFRITSLGCCAAGSFPEIIVWRSLLDWCSSLISKNTFPSVLSIVYPFTIIIIITLFIWATKSMFAFCFGQGGEQNTKWLLFMRVRWSFWQIHGCLFFRNVDNFGKDFCEHFTPLQLCQEDQSLLSKRG